MADLTFTPQTVSPNISPDMLAQIQESPVVGKPSIKPTKVAPVKKSEISSAETINPFIAILLGFLALAAGVLTVLVIANYARLH